MSASSHHTTRSTTPNPAKPAIPADGVVRSRRARRRRHRALAGTVLVAGALGLAACGAGPVATPFVDDPIATDDAATGDAERSSTTTTTAATDAVAIDADVTAALYMVDEEKLALDVYTALGDLWGARVFDNIAASETRHVASVRSLLDQLGVTDPTVGLEAGEFADPAFEQLYEQLVAQGSTSLEAAHEVGVSIEELDITDLEQRLTEVADPATVNVFESLLAGSRNHLDAFERQLAA